MKEKDTSFRICITRSMLDTLIKNTGNTVEQVVDMLLKEVCDNIVREYTVWEKSKKE